MADPSGKAVTFLMTGTEGRMADWEVAPEAVEQAGVLHDVPQSALPGVEPGKAAIRLREGTWFGEKGQPPRTFSPPAMPLSVVPNSVGLPLPTPGTEGWAPSGPASLPFEPSYPFPMPNVLAGRQHELQSLRQIVERGRGGGQMVLIGGPAGIGKSTLAGAVVREARERGFVCLVGRSYELDNPIPYGSIRDALSDYLLARDPHELWSELGSVLRDLEPIVPELRYHLHLHGADSGRPLESGHVLSVLHSCLRALAARQPVLICLEDLHATDDATVAALPYIGRQIRRLPVVVLATYRTDEMTAEHQLVRLLSKLVRERVVAELRLGPLATAETAQLAAGLLEGAVDDTLTDWLQEITEGNPLFGEQMLLALREEGRLVRMPDGWQMISSVCPLPPPIVRAVVERRLHQLKPRSRSALDMAAVLGHAASRTEAWSFGLMLLAAALGVERSLAVAHLEALFDAHLIRECDTGYRFEQPLLCEALYQGMSTHRRASIELCVAQARELLRKGGSNGLYSPLPVGDSPPERRC